MRCIVEVPGQSCLLCRAHDTSCIKAKESISSGTARDRQAKRRRIELITQDENTPTNSRLGEHQVKPDHVRRPSAFIRDGRGDGGARAAMIVGPVAAEDIHIIEEYMTSKRSPEEVRDGSYNVISNDPAKPILYLSVPARRKGLSKSGDSPGSSQKEIVEQILGPLVPDLISV